MGEASQVEFVEKVFPAELKDINARRARVRGEALPRYDGAPTEHPAEIAVGEGTAPSIKHGLVGLALSGGGIRSAAFSLGVLQALHAEGIFPSIDYLSTVSGGGWIGSCLSALMRSPEGSFPFVPPANPSAKGAADDTPAPPKNRVLEYLRDRTSALVPSGFSGGSGMLARVVRGALITVAMLMATLIAPALLLSMLVRYYLALLSLTVQRGAVGELPWSSFVVITPRLLGGSLLLLLLMPVIRTLLPGPRRLVSVDRLFVGLFTLCLAALAFETHAFVTWWAARRIDSVHLDFGAFLSVLFHRLWPTTPPGPVTLAIAGACFALLLVFRAALARLLPLLRIAALGLVAVGSLAPLYLFVLYISVFEGSAGYAGATGLVLNPRSGTVIVSLLGLAFIVLMDTNEASLHSLFRAQIAKLFIIRRSGAELTPDQRIPLSALSQPGSAAPYHLLNAALNLQGSGDTSLRGRNSDFFVFSKHFIGGPRTGYCPTADFERVAPDLDLATAMATSAAAAAPNMGTYTLRPVVLLMAFLNLRLGYWLLNPRKVARGASGTPGLWERFRAFPAGWCYFRELASALHEHGRHVYLSDGGHLENTGAYELLRRRCRYIIVCDAEEDPTMGFGGLAALIRFARLDLGVEIDISLDDLAPDERGASRRHAVLGSIRYPERDGMFQEVGQLVYIKSSRTGDEHPVIGQYRAANPLFPHESTANQAFGEAQFEAYRALGEHITRGLAGRSFLSFPGQDPVVRWFLAMEARALPPLRYDGVFPGLRDELEEIEALLRAPEAAGYFAELYPELASGHARAEVAPAVLHEVAMRQIHLIASTYTQLHLDEESAIDHPWNRGWLQIFRRWMASPSFQRVWLIGAQSYGPWFRQFCEEALVCMMFINWQTATREELAQHGFALPPTADPTRALLLVRCSLSTSAAEIAYAGAKVLAVTLVDGRASLAVHAFDVRPGLRDLMCSDECRDALDEMLVGLGLPRVGAPAGPALGPEALASLNAMTVFATAATG